MCSCRNPDIKDGVNITHLLRCSQRKQVATSPLVSPRNDVWGTTAEIPYWWRVTTHEIWVRVLIGCAAREICNQKHYPDLGSDVSSEWNFCQSSSDVISQGNQQWRGEISAVFSVGLVPFGRLAKCCHYQIGPCAPYSGKSRRRPYLVNILHILFVKWFT